MILTHAHVKTMTGTDLNDGFVIVEGATIKAVGAMADCPAYDGERLDLGGRTLCPAFVDAHTHLGMWGDAGGFESEDGNEDTDPATPHLRAVDAVNPLDRCFADALHAGVMTAVTGPGSANAIGGQLIAIKTYGRRIDDMIVKAPAAIKMALGENPKCTYHAKNQTPTTRMAIAAVIRAELHRARRYMDDVARAQDDEDLDPPEYDPKSESLMPLLRREVQAHIHAHRADDIFTAIRLIREFHLDGVILHGTEAHLIAPDVAAEGVPIVVGPLLCDRSKPELLHLTTAGAGTLYRAGVPFCLSSDHASSPIQYLGLTAGLCVRDGLPHDIALEALTCRPADILRLSHRVGRIQAGLDADLIAYTGDPFSPYWTPDLLVAGGVVIKEALRDA